MFTIYMETWNWTDLTQTHTESIQEVVAMSAPCLHFVFPNWNLIHRKGFRD